MSRVCVCVCVCVPMFVCFARMLMSFRYLCSKKVSIDYSGSGVAASCESHFGNLETKFQPLLRQQVLLTDQTYVCMNLILNLG